MRTTGTIAAALAVLALMVCSPATATDPEPTERELKIRELMEITGSGDLGIQMMEGLRVPMEQAMPQVPSEWWDRYFEKVDARGLEELVVPVYDKHLTDEELDALLDLYRSPVGQSIAAKLPLILDESMRLGGAWGVELANEILRELAADGYEVPEDLKS